ncbi:type III-B CRISPR module-associated Cmr3 family protein [Saccharopolyspora hattusasensis]|uniref:type III-B CRISPR module-associated Cmr3 family protein n=1 Tax=Saccharopolyspora hattusasensis TaxID=1128679 RepID=UPI003D978DE6
MTDSAKLTVTLTEPVAVVRHLRNDFRQESYDHITGTAVRGALAAQWLLAHGDPDDDFLEIFEGDGVFGPLHATASLPVPLSVKVHKYRADDRCRVLWWDAIHEEVDVCQYCKQKLEFSKGGPVGKIRRTPRTRNALDAEGIARSGNLFNQSSIAAGNVFEGWLSGPALRSLQIDGEPVRTLSLGGKRTVQGNAEVTIDFEAEPEPVELIGKDVILRLASPGIFVDALGLPAAEPDLGELSEVLGVETSPGVKPWQRWTEVGGWHLASGLPKPTERAVQAGSTYRIRCAERPSEAARRALMVRGVGLRRREGFGALCRPAPPLSFYEWGGVLARLRIDMAAVEKTLPQLREHTRELRSGIENDAPFQDQLARDAQYASALRKLLDVTDPVLYGRLVARLESGK